MDIATVMAWLEVLKSLGFGFTVAAIVFVWALYKRKVVFGWYATALEHERDAWRETSLEGKVIFQKWVEREERRG